MLLYHLDFMISFILFFYFFQYDVELYQRIEFLIGKKLPLYKTEEADVMCMQERVSEARRIANRVSNIFCYLLKYL